jgi:hypothetical protein
MSVQTKVQAIVGIVIGVPRLHADVLGLGQVGDEFTIDYSKLVLRVGLVGESLDGVTQALGVSKVDIVKADFRKEIGKFVLSRLQNVGMGSE